MSSYNPDHLSARITAIDALCIAARKITLPLFGQMMDVENKASGNDYDPVTQADKDAEEKLRELIIVEFPNDTIIGEEFPDHHGTSGWSWTLDPIDGTRAFVAGVPVWSTLIAVSWNGQPIASAIDLPALKQCFTGSPDGSFRIDEHGKTKLTTRACSDLRDVVLGCTEPLAMFTQGERASYEMIRRTARFSRLGLDAFAYCLLASGHMDMILEALLKPCDVAALVPVVENAGGRITSWEGGSPIEGGRVIAVGDTDLLKETYVYLRRAMDTPL